MEEERVVETPNRSVEITQNTGPLLAPLGFAFWRMKGAFEREMGISAGTWFTLALLAREDGMSQGELSQRFDVDPSRVTRLAKRLEREGLLRKERDRGDKRVVRMYLTDKGRGLIEGLSGRRERFDQRIGAVLSPEELKELRRMLGVLADSAEDWVGKIEQGWFEPQNGNLRRADARHARRCGESDYSISGYAGDRG